MTAATADAARAAPRLTLRLLGGFRLGRAGAGRFVPDWRRRSGKTLVKLMATCPGHALHKEQILEILWPDADLASALNSFGKALHDARHALEPELPRRRNSAYLRLTDGLLSLDTEHVEIDADRFEMLAQDALRHRDISGYESAAEAYSGDLLPEDRYAEWCADRRNVLSELHVRVLLGLAEALELSGAHNESADRLLTALQQDPTREEIHYRLMRVYARMGTPDRAVRQFHRCQEILRRELEMAPQPQTVSLFHDVLAGRTQGEGSALSEGSRDTQTAPAARDAGLPALPSPRMNGEGESVQANLANGASRPGGGAGGALSEDQREELARLRRENTELRVEREVLKRSVALWVKEAMGG